MRLALPAHIEKLIQDRVSAGQYKTAEDVVAAALSQLDQQETGGEFEAGELDRLLAEGERSGQPLDGEQVFAELRAIRNRPQNKAG